MKKTKSCVMNIYMVIKIFSSISENRSHFIWSKPLSSKTFFIVFYLYGFYISNPHDILSHDFVIMLNSWSWTSC